MEVILFLLISGFSVVGLYIAWLFEKIDRNENATARESIDAREKRFENNRANREAYQKAKENEALIQKMINELGLKVVEEWGTVKDFDFWEGEKETEVLIDLRIEPKTDNEKRIDELQKEIEMLRELDKEMD